MADMPESGPTRLRFLPRTCTAIRYTGTNLPALNDTFGEAWPETLIGRPLTIGDWLYRHDDSDEIFVMTQIVVDALTEPAQEPDRA